MNNKKSYKLKKEFWSKVADKCNLNISIVKLVYMAIMKTILLELLENECIIMPQWGKFKVTTFKKRKFKHWSTGQMVCIYGHKRITFVPCDELKKYIRVKADQNKYSESNIKQINTNTLPLH